MSKSFSFAEKGLWGTVCRLMSTVPVKSWGHLLIQRFFFIFTIFYIVKKNCEDIITMK